MGIAETRVCNPKCHARSYTLFPDCVLVPATIYYSEDIVSTSTGSNNILKLCYQVGAIYTGSMMVVYSLEIKGGG